MAAHVGRTGWARRSTAGLALAGAVALAGCGAGHPWGASRTPTSPAPAGRPVADLTVVVLASSPSTSPTPPTGAELEDLTRLAEESGRTLDDVLAAHRGQEAFSAYVSRVDARFPDSLSASDAGGDGGPAWVALVGEVPAQAVALAQGLPLDVELRGGAVLTDDERDAATVAGVQAYAAAVGSSVGWSAHLDAPTARFTVDLAPGAAPDPSAADAVVTAARAAIGRGAPFTVGQVASTRDPDAPEPAVWFLPAGRTADPTATSVEVLVAALSCSAGRGARMRIDEPEVEVTSTEVRIGLATPPSPGTGFCQAGPLVPLVVDLGVPLGDRVLVDAHGTADDHHVMAPEHRYDGIVVPPAAPAATAGTSPVGVRPAP